MFFLFLILITTLMFLTLKIKIELENIKFNTANKKHLNTGYKIKIKLYTFFVIPILKISIDNKKIEKIIKKPKIEEIIEKEKKNIIENKNNIDIKTINDIRKINIEILKINLGVQIGTENAAITPFIITIISTIISIFLSKINCTKSKYKIIPVYIDKNFINIDFSGIFQIKMIHIINTICILNKKRKGDKNERTSNRRTYDYSYE